MKKIISAVALAASLAISVHAAPPSQQSVEKLAIVAKVDLIHDAMIAQLERSVEVATKQALRGEVPTPADKAILDDLHANMGTMVDEQLGGTKIRTMFEKVYAESYTQEEVDGLIAFYSTPVGQVFAAKQPEISGKIGVMIQQQIGPMGMRLQMAMMSALRKIQQAHAPKAAPKPAPAPAAKPAAPATAPGSAPVAPKAN